MSKEIYERAKIGTELWWVCFPNPIALSVFRIDWLVCGLIIIVVVYSVFSTCCIFYFSIEIDAY